MLSQPGFLMGPTVERVAELERLKGLIRERIGVVPPESDLLRLLPFVMNQASAQGDADLSGYLERMALLPDGNAAWEALIAQVITPESYFFRDRGQFDLLQRTLAPKLIERNRSTRRLRVLSVGCSTGEEPYSLAMVLGDMEPGRDGWSLEVLGVDLDEGSLERARRGRFGPWSFRKVEAFKQQTWFDQVNELEWQVKEPVRRRVQFRRLNLVGDEDAAAWEGMKNTFDLVLCRNVFIYFTPEVVVKAAARLGSLIKEGGYLITGHVELSGKVPAGLAMERYPESMAYRREESVTPTSAPPAPHSTKSSVRRASAFPLKKKASPWRRRQVAKQSPPTTERSPWKALFLAGRYAEAAAGEADGDGEAFEAAYWSARSLANLGRGEEARGRCREAMALDPFSALPLVLLARLALERGEEGEAAELLRKAHYLNPGSVSACLELGALYERRGESDRAGKMRCAAWELLKKLPEESLVEGYEEWTAGTMMAQLAALLDG